MSNVRLSFHGIRFCVILLASIKRAFAMASSLALSSCWKVPFELMMLPSDLVLSEMSYEKYCFR